jgi:excisionase family DNA binding protein
VRIDACVAVGKLLTVRQVAGRLSVHYQTAWKMVDAEQIPCIRLPNGRIRVDEDHLKALLAPELEKKEPEG